MLFFFFFFGGGGGSVHEAPQGFRGTEENDIYFIGTGDQRPSFEGTVEQNQYLGKGEIRKMLIFGKQKKTIFFRGIRNQVTPLEGLIHTKTKYCVLYDFITF